MILWLLTIGVVSMLGQVVLLRELNVAFFGSELIYILAMGVWLFWTAAGAAFGRRAHLPSDRSVRWLLLLLGAALPPVLILVRGLRILFGAVPGAYLPFARQMAAMGLALLPVSVMLGLLFQWAAKIYAERRRGTLAAAYAVESAGGLAGGVLATLFLMVGVRNIAAGLICALLSVGAALWPWRRGRPRGLVPAGAVVAILILLALLRSADLDARLTAWNHPSLVATLDSPYGRVTVTEDSGLISVFENDALAFESEGTAAEEFVHLAGIQRPRLGSVLVLGGGVEGLVREALLHDPARIDDVELNETLLRIASPRLPVGISPDPRVRLHIDDPRRFLERAGAYDLILVGMPEPASGRTNRFYTREFFARCAERLGEEGVLALRLRGAENLWTPQLARRTGSIHRALRSAFGDVVVLPGVTNIILASRAPLERDPERLGARLSERGIEARLVIPAYVDYLYTNDRFFELNDLLARTRAPVNTDARPICYQYTLLLWLSRFFLAVAHVEVPDLDPGRVLGSPWIWFGIAAAAGALLLSRRRPLARRSLLAAAAGFVGMILETALILHYQTVRGVLYQDLGLLLTAFMAGLALGAAAVHGMARRGRGRGLTRLTGAGLVAAFAALNLLVVWLLPAGIVTGLAGVSALLLACGFLVAALFAYSSLYMEPDQRTIISPLYAADLIGGCLGSLAASLFLIPVAGLQMTAASMIVALALAALLL